MSKSGLLGVHFLVDRRRKSWVQREMMSLGAYKCIFWSKYEAKKGTSGNKTGIQDCFLSPEGYFDGPYVKKWTFRGIFFG